MSFQIFELFAHVSNFTGGLYSAHSIILLYLRTCSQFQTQPFANVFAISISNPFANVFAISNSILFANVFAISNSKSFLRTCSQFQFKSFCERVRNFNLQLLRTCSQFSTNLLRTCSHQTQLFANVFCNFNLTFCERVRNFKLNLLRTCSQFQTQILFANVFRNFNSNLFLRTCSAISIQILLRTCSQLKFNACFNFICNFINLFHIRYGTLPFFCPKVWQQFSCQSAISIRYY